MSRKEWFTRLYTPRPVLVALVAFGTFVDLLAYSIAVPVLPDVAGRYGAGPSTIGLLFASFGVTLLAASIPMGAVSDRVGRKVPLVAGLAALAASSLAFAFARGLPWLFAARLIQGAADAVAWVVGFALVADLYGPHERGRVMGIVVAMTGLGFIVGPPIGGWLYEIGGIRMPFLIVSALAGINAVAVALARIPAPAERSAVPLGAVLRVPAILLCALAVIAGAATVAMLEPMLALWYQQRLGLTPGRIGLLFAGGAVSSAVANVLFGRLADRWGGRSLTLGGLVATAALMPLVTFAPTPFIAGALMVATFAAFAMIVTPSLAFIGEAARGAAVESYGVVYGVYNVAWAMGLLTGPAIGGWMYERVGLRWTTFLWAPALVVVTVVLARVRTPGTQMAPPEIPT